MTKNYLTEILRYVFLLCKFTEHSSKKLNDIYHNSHKRELTFEVNNQTNLNFTTQSNNPQH